MEVEDRVVERHRHLLLGLEAHRGVEFLVIGDRRQLERAQNRALVGDADAHLLAQLAVAEQLAQRLGERALVEDLALADGVCRQRQCDSALGDDRAVDVRLHGGDMTGLDVQADDVRAGAAAAAQVERRHAQVQRRFGQLGLGKGGHI